MPLFWVIDPDKQSGWQYHTGGEPERVSDVTGARKIEAGLKDLFRCWTQADRGTRLRTSSLSDLSRSGL